MHDDYAFQHLVGESHWTERIRRRVVQISRYSYPVLITGPSGTGKEVIARAIHAHSPRAHQPLIPFRCGQLPEAFTSLQLFGHTAAAGKLTDGSSLGCLGAAQGGTILLHEVGDLDLANQDCLFQVLQKKRLRPVGASDDQSVDVRVIATSSRDLGEAARRGEFRFQLLYSLNAISVHATSLSERSADIAPLASHIVARITVEHGLAYRYLAPAAVALFEAYEWPGNVDEMETVLERALLGAERRVLDLEDFADLFEAVQSQVPRDELKLAQPERVNEYESIPPLRSYGRSWPSLTQQEAVHLRATLRRAGQNVTVAAGMLGIDPDELRKKLVEHRIRPHAVVPRSFSDERARTR